MTLLLHTCCAACLIYPLKKLREKGFEVRGFFYNPNIHSFAEYKNREQALGELCKTYPVEIDYPDYAPADFFNAVNLKEDNAQRCYICWQLRLKKTAEFAKEKRFDYFSTTLLVSPYQDQELLKQIGNDISKETGIDFYYEDFRPGFKRAHNEAKAKGIYCQKYCGCIYSEIERYSKRARKYKTKK